MPLLVPCLFFVEGGAVDVGASAFQLILKVAGPRVEMRVGWDQRQLDIVSDTFRKQEAQRAWQESVCGQTIGQRREADLFYFHGANTLFLV